MTDEDDMAAPTAIAQGARCRRTSRRHFRCRRDRGLVDAGQHETVVLVAVVMAFAHAEDAQLRECFLQKPEKARFVLGMGAVVAASRDERDAAGLRTAETAEEIAGGALGGPIFEPDISASGAASAQP